MKDIICPNCNTAFKLDDAGFADIVKISGFVFPTCSYEKSVKKKENRCSEKRSSRK